MVDNWNISQSLFFSEKLIFAQTWAKRVQIAPKIGFLFFGKILSLVFLGNNLKSKLILSDNFDRYENHICESSGSRVMGQNAVSQLNWMIL